jgi:hypothetical protein
MIGWTVGLALAMQTLQPVNTASSLVGDFKFYTIRKAEGEKDWPFVDNEGRLACVTSLGQTLVYFFPTSAGKQKGEVVLDVNPISVVTQYIGRKDVFLPAKSPEELIKRIAPFVAMGQMLCKQNKGPVVPGSEL